MRRIIIEEIPWVYACCDADITVADVASASRFQNEQRRAEHLAWRRVVRRELGRNTLIEYNEVGAPIVDVADTHISVAHGAGRVAVAISDKMVGIDIESIERAFEHVASRYMSIEERHVTSNKHWPAMAWCAKEALYKLYGRKGLELIGDIQLQSYDTDTQTITAFIGGNCRALVEIKHDDDAVVAVAYFCEDK